MDGGARLRVKVLGAFQVSHGDAVLAVPGARLQGLVVRLALAGGRAVEQGVLVDAVWAEDPPAGPAHALQTLVSRLRRSLGSAGDVTQVAGGYRLAVDAVDVDALRFEQLAVAGRDYLRTGDWNAAAGVLGQAVRLWGDRPGAEPTVVAAVSPAAATRLAKVSIEVVTDLAEVELSLGRADAAADRLTALLAEQSVDERAAALLMDALAAQGRQAEALAVYERIRETLADVLGADPGAALRERHLSLLRTDQPAPQTILSNLPASLTSFIGRADDLARIETLLAAGRLVTVLGPGGAGKTRLAVEAARRHRHEYRDGAWLIDLAAITEPAKVGAALLAAIGLRGAALFEASAKLRGDPIGEVVVLADQLGGRESLLVLDNCEHLIDAVAQLVSALLARCAELRVLATSREPLAIDGEALVPLGPLALPEPGANVEQARGTASVRLFAERAAAVRPGFDVDEQNLDEVLRIVRALDGMPLALELAAARLRTLSLTDLTAGLADRFRLLTAGSRAALPRHRTLRAVIGWSWDLLTDPERIVAERISALPGGVTPASATAVCADNAMPADNSVEPISVTRNGGTLASATRDFEEADVGPALGGIPCGTAIPADDISELLARLVDRSLLQLAPDTGGYRMLETIREYGLQRLAEQGTLGGVRDLAAQYFAELAARYDPLLRGPGQLDALHVLRVEYDNVLAALRYRCDTGDAERAIGLAVNLTWYWHMLGRHTDISYWLGRAVAMPTARASVARDIASGTLLLNTIASMSDALEELQALADRLLSHPELPGVGALTALRLVSLAGTEASPAIIQRLVDGPDGWLAGLARMVRAHLAENAGRLDQVRSDVTAALECFVRAGDQWGRAKALPLRALLRQYDSDLDGALADLAEAERLARQFGALGPADEFFLDLRSIDLRMRLDTARVIEMIAATRARVQGSASPELAILLDAREAALRVRLGDLDRARELVESAEAELSEQLSFGDHHGQAVVGAARGALCLELGDGPGAEQALSRAYAAAVDSTDLPLVATVAVTVAGLAAHYDRHRDAAVLLGAAARLRGADDPTDPQIDTLSKHCRTALGDERFAEKYQTGRQLTTRLALTQADPARLRRTGLTPAAPPEPGGTRRT
ncbi:BTAD domain-containing putative transcriptional regulator [Nocardia sp. NPDC060256]|uniref:BTAD domain-containing putative transcriptional regulator n=1 Tax=unclassified Nocardia TaxID=2637762 RepID=UPI0036554C9A